MAEQLDFFHQLYGDVAKHWKDGETNDCGVYVVNRHTYELGSYKDGFHMELNVVKSGNKILYEESHSIEHYGSASPLDEYSAFITTDHSAEDVARKVEMFLKHSIIGDPNISGKEKKYNQLMECPHKLAEMLKRDLNEV